MISMIERVGLAALATAVALTASGALAAAPPLAVRKLDDAIVVEADGRSTRTIRQERTPGNKATAEGIANLQILFNPSLESIDIVEAYTEKADGSRKPVDPAAIRTQLAPGVPNVPMFADIQQKIVVFPDLAPGDTQVLAYRRVVTRPVFPGYFSLVDDFPQNVEWRNTRMTIIAPPGMTLRVDARGVDVARAEDASGTHLAFTYEKRDPLPREQYGVSPLDRRPRLAVSSFPDFAAMAGSYMALNADKMAVTPRIQAQADQITHGIDDRRKQAAALYEWVSQHVRYVALYLGRGGVEAHPAEQVLDAGYGDCKDHTVLLSALLAAKGIDSRTVMLNLGDAYTLFTVPTLAPMNHVITYIPEFDLYADPTSAVATFGTLTPQHFGKPAVMTGTPNAVVTLPASDAARDHYTTRTIAELRDDGTISGQTIEEASGTFATTLRFVEKAIEAQGSATIAESVLNRQNVTGSGEWSPRRIDIASPSFHITGTFTLDARPDALTGEALQPPLGLAVLVRPGDLLLGPMARTSLPDTEPTPCMAGHQVEELRLTIPKDRRPTKLPSDRRIDGTAFTYTTHWSFADSTVTVRRDMVSRIATPVCDGALRKEAAAAQREIRRDQQATFQLQAVE